MIDGLTSAAAGPLEPVLAATLQASAKLARFSRYEATVLRNLELALPELSAARRRSIARGVRAHAANLLMEWARLARASRSESEGECTRAWLERQVTVDESIRVAHEVRSRGRGLLIATAHIGNWELLAARMRQLGFEGAVVGFQRRKDPSAEWLVRMRQGLGVETIGQAQAGRRALEVLRAGRTLGILADLQARRIANQPAKFFGHLVPTVVAPAALARAAGCAVVPAYCVRAGNTYRLSFEAPLELAPGVDRRGAAGDLAQRLNAVFEKWIRAVPEQWAWHQPRFFVRPRKRS